MRRVDRLWKELNGPGLPPCADKRAVKSRVDAVLDEAPVERRTHMKRKASYILAAAALAAALGGSALAVGANMDAITAFFGGDRAPVEDYVDNVSRSVSDDNYTFTVESSVSAGENTYLVVTVKALNEETREFLFSDKFSDMDTFSLRPVEDEAQAAQEAASHEDPIAMIAMSLGVHPLPATDGDSRSFELDANLGGKAKALKVRLGWMEEGKYVEVPLNYAPGVTVKLGGSGVGVCDLETLEPGTITIDEVVLTPLTCKIIISGEPDTGWKTTDPRILFRMADGSVYTQSQMMSHTDGGDIGNGRYEHNYRFKDVQDLDQIAGIIAFDVEYPLDGSKPRAVEHDAALDPVTVTRTGRLVEEHGFTLPVRELMEKLGGTCEWDAETGAVTCTYRGVSIALRAGETTATINGETVELREAPGMVDGKLCADDAETLFDAWGLDGFVQRTSLYDQRQPDGSVPLVWHDWLIIP